MLVLVLCGIRGKPPVHHKGLRAARGDASNDGYEVRFLGSRVRAGLGTEAGRPRPVPGLLALVPGHLAALPSSSRARDAVDRASGGARLRSCEARFPGSHGLHGRWAWGVGPDVLVNDAGQMFLGLTAACTADQRTRQLDVDVVGTHRMNRATLPTMRQRGSGLFVNLGSVAGRLGAPFLGVCQASKWAVVGCSMALRGGPASSGTDMAVVEPGASATELLPRSPRLARAASPPVPGSRTRPSRAGEESPTP